MNKLFEHPARAAARERAAALLAAGEVRADSDIEPSEALCACLLSSEFAFDVLKVKTEWLDTIAQPPEFPLSGASSDLAEYRVRRSIAQIALEVSGALSIEQSLAYASDTAKRCIAAALALAEEEMQARFGVARDGEGGPVRLSVFAMGKLGGHELNFSSDIDLIMCFARSGESDGARSLDNSEYFARITRRCAQLLSEPCPFGSAYRVDLRLRPFGSAGQAALSFAAMEEYYQREGRDWERYAWIKARPVAGDLAAGEVLRERLRPFIYRRYLDFAAFEGMREMKALVDAEVRKADRGSNLKLGPGGIREIEFLIQLEQLIRGGRDDKLRVAGSLPALDALAQAGWLTPEDATQLRSDYLFLRAVENRVQMLRDQQCHDLPSDRASQDRIAASLGYERTDVFLADLASLRERVHRRFAEAVTLPSAEAATETRLEDSLEKTRGFLPRRGRAKVEASARLLSVFKNEDAFEQSSQIWQRLTGPERDQIGVGDKPAEISVELWQALLGFADSSSVQNASARARSRIDRVVPMFWSLALKLDRASDIEPCALRLIAFLQAISGRSAYVALLAEKPQVAARLVQLFAQSAWLAQLITCTPMLLDELLDVRRLALPNDFQSLQKEAQAEFATGENDDLEQAFELLISFKHSVQLRLAVGFLQGHIDAVGALRALSDLADVLIRRVLDIAWRELARSVGLPGGCKQAGQGFAILAYGSLGGRELNFASDLDLVFVFDAKRAEAETEGGKSIDGQRFYVRLAQRVISLLTSQTRFGALYAIDTRLRPNGNKGLLVTTFDSYRDYQRNEAWLWEHQALVRARCCAGDEHLARDFQALRQEILSQARPPDKVRREIGQMRERMRTELDRSRGELMDLKQGRGGLVDIEFALQERLFTQAPAARYPSESEHLIPQYLPELAPTHRRLLELGLRATLELRPRLVEKKRFPEWPTGLEI